MPYITKERRDALDGIVVQMEKLIDSKSCAGDLNYLFTNIALIYLSNVGESYQAYNDLIGALEGCKLELYRRHVAVYEDLKIKENGDL